MLISVQGRRILWYRTLPANIELDRTSRSLAIEHQTIDGVEGRRGVGLDPVPCPSTTRTPMTDESLRLTTLPVPKFAMGEKVYAPVVRDAAEEIQCPDCLGSGRWTYKSPAGTTGEVSCPRCGGQKCLKLRSYRAAVECRHVGEIRVSTTPETYGGKCEYVRYMCNETGIGSGSLYDEKDLFKTEDGAMIAAQARTARMIADLDDKNTEQGAKRAEIRDLSAYQITKAAVEEVNHELFEYKYGLKSLVEHIHQLSKSTYLMCETGEAKFWDREGAGCTSLGLGPDVITLLQEHLVAYNKVATKMLRSLREAPPECECP